VHRSHLRGTARQLGQIFSRGDIAAQPLQLVGVGFQQRFETADAARHRQHPGTALQQGRAQRQTDSGTGAGDDSQTILKLAFHHHLRARRTPSHKPPRGSGSKAWY